MTLCVAETEQLQRTHQVAFRWEEDRLWKKECDYFTSVQTHKDKINVFPWLWEWEQKIFSSIKPWYLHLVACEDCTFFHGHFASECALSFWIFRKVMQNPNFPSDSVFELQKKCVVSVHTWFSDIRECIADWSQSKHILGLHFKVVPEWRQRKYLMKDSVIDTSLTRHWMSLCRKYLWPDEGEENVNDCSRCQGKLGSGWFTKRTSYICTIAKICTAQ